MRISNFLCLDFVCDARATPLDSETGWTGKLWSKLREKYFFSGEKKIFTGKFIF